MNRRGQVFVAFVILLPLILIFLAYIIDNGLILKNLARLEELNKSVLTYALNNPDKTVGDLKSYIVKNEDKLKDIVITLDSPVKIKLVKEIPSVFGQVIGTKHYTITSYYEGYIKENKIVIKKIDRW